MDRLQAILIGGYVALSNLALHDPLGELLDRVRHVLTVATAPVLLLEDEKYLSVNASSGLARPADAAHGERKVWKRVPISSGLGVAGKIAASREPMTADALCKVEGVRPIIRNGVRSFVGANNGVGSLLRDPLHHSEGVAWETIRQGLCLEERGQ